MVVEGRTRSKKTGEPLSRVSGDQWMEVGGRVV
jgi:hypothetical protein